MMMTVLLEHSSLRATTWLIPSKCQRHPLLMFHIPPTLPTSQARKLSRSCTSCRRLPLRLSSHCPFQRTSPASSRLETFCGSRSWQPRTGTCSRCGRVGQEGGVGWVGGVVRSVDVGWVGVVDEDKKGTNARKKCITMYHFPTSTVAILFSSLSAHFCTFLHISTHFYKTSKPAMPPSSTEAQASPQAEQGQVGGSCQTCSQRGAVRPPAAGLVRGRHAGRGAVCIDQRRSGSPTCCRCVGSALFVEMLLR